MKTKRGVMDLSLFKKVVMQCQEFGISDISLHTIGEPLLHPHIIDIIKITKESNLKVLLSTNALLLDKQISEAIITSGLDFIRYSIEGIDKSSYEQIRCGSNFERVMSNIAYFKKIRDSQGRSPYITINSIMMKSLLGTVADFYRLWGKFADEIYFTYIGNFNQIPHEEIKNEVLKEEPPLKRRPCYMLWETMVVQWDGKVSACCMDFENELIVGDINKNTLWEIWESDIYNKIRQYHLKREFNPISLCKRCDAGNRSTVMELFKLNQSLLKLKNRGDKIVRYLRHL
jgi:radical SAM protein with 4Fe4S-binding SPASM domain